MNLFPLVRIVVGHVVVGWRSDDSGIQNITSTRHNPSLWNRVINSHPFSIVDVVIMIGVIVIIQVAIVVGVHVVILIVVGVGKIGYA